MQPKHVRALQTLPLRGTYAIIRLESLELRIAEGSREALEGADFVLVVHLDVFNGTTSKGMESGSRVNPVLLHDDDIFSRNNIGAATAKEWGREDQGQGCHSSKKRTHDDSETGENPKNRRQR
jgi:hypothetical protein